MPDLNQLETLTNETMQIFEKAASQGIYSTNGPQGVDLSGFTSLVPVNVPARNNTSAFPRVIANDGSPSAQWETWLNINNQQPSAFVGLDYAGAMALFDKQNVYAPYQALGVASRVTLDAVAVGRNYADPLAQATLQALLQLMIAQDIAIPNAQGWSLGTPTAPSLAASATGGSIPASVTVYVSVAVRSGMNYYYGGSTPASPNATTTVSAGSTNSVVATSPALKGGVAWDWYVGTSATNLVYYTTTTTGKVTITSVPTTAQALPPLQLLGQLAPGNTVNPWASPAVPGNGTPPTADTSTSPKFYNGLIASTLGDYGAAGPVVPGTGTPTSAIFIDNGGQALAASGSGIGLLDQVNEAIWSSVQLSPTAYMVNSAQAIEITDILTSTGIATTLLPPTDADARTNLAGGGYISRYINSAVGGVPIAIEVHPHVPPGTIFVRTDYVPFPGSNIGTSFEVRCQYDTTRFDYAANYNPSAQGGGPRFDFEVRSLETLINRAPSAQAVLTNIG